MGSLVLYRDGKEGNVLYLVDGQQRTTTTVITLAALRDELSAVGDANLAQGIQNYLQTKDVDNKDRFILEHTPPNKFFQNAVMLAGGDEKYPQSTQEDRNLAAARAFIITQLKFHLLKFQTKDDKIAAIKTIRDKILALQYISVELDNEDDAYVIFETLNTSNKRFGEKFFFTKYIKAKVKGADLPRRSGLEL